jgi:predicted Zn-dependent protease
MRLVRLAVAAILVFLLPASLCALTLDEEKKYGREIYEEISRSARIYSDPDVCIYMGLVKTRLENAADLPLPIKLTVIDSPTLEAFATVGGYVFVTSGLLGQSDKEEEIAGVLAHEFGHVGRRHVAKAVEKEKYINWGTVAALLLAALAPGDAKGAVLVTGMGAGAALGLKYTRESEEEADRVGVQSSEKAGYSGIGSAEFLKKLRATSEEKDFPQYLLSHPYSDERVTRIEKLATTRKTRIDDSFFPFLLARVSLVGKPLSKQSEEMWFNLLRRDPKNPVNVYGAALVYSMKGDTERGAALLRQMNSPYRSLFLGEFLVNSGRFKEAASVLSAETHPVARYWLARAYEGEGDLASAGRVYRELLPYASTYPEAYQKLGMTFGRQGQEAAGYEYLGRYYLETGRDGAARTNLEKAISKYGINAPESEELLKLLDTVGGGKKGKVESKK